MKKQDLSLALVSVNAPVLCGLYQDNGENLELFDCISSSDTALKALPYIFESFFPPSNQTNKYRDFQLKRIFYANGPGSFTALKLTHIFLQTLKLVHHIELYATSSFYFTSYPYLKAFGNQYFTQCDGNILLVHQDCVPPYALETLFALPQRFHPKDFAHDTQPLYILPPI